MPTLQIDQDKCIRCGACVSVCPMGLFRRESDDQLPTLINGAEDLCIACGHCTAGCPTAAIALDHTPGDQLPPVHNPEEADFRALADVIRGRRSIRQYDPQPVPREEIEEVMEVVRWAPTARNLRPVKWIVINNPDEVRRLGGLVIDWFRTNEKFESIVNTWESGYDIIFRGAPGLIIAYAERDSWNPVVDCTIAVTTLELAATARGLGVCWAGFFMGAAQKYSPIAHELKIPENCRIEGGLMIGRSKETYHRVPARGESPIRWME